MPATCLHFVLVLVTEDRNKIKRDNVLQSGVIYARVPKDGPPSLMFPDLPRLNDQVSYRDASKRLLDSSFRSSTSGVRPSQSGPMPSALLLLFSDSGFSKFVDGLI